MEILFKIAFLVVWVLGSLVLLLWLVMREVERFELTVLDALTAKGILKIDADDFAAIMMYLALLITFGLLILADVKSYLSSIHVFIKLTLSVLGVASLFFLNMRLIPKFRWVQKMLYF